MDSLWLSLMQLWERIIGFLPSAEGGLAAATSSAAAGGGGGGVAVSTTVLTLYCWEGSVQGAVAWVVEELQQQQQGRLSGCSSSCGHVYRYRRYLMLHRQRRQQGQQQQRVGRHSSKQELVRRPLPREWRVG